MAAAQLDTELTPIAKPPSQWAMLGGVEFNTKELMKGSPTPATVDFYATAFSPRYLDNPTGFFAGAECKNDAITVAELDENENENENGCERRPSIYRFSVDDAGDERIERVLGGVPDPGGFVGGVAWIDADRALAVGGTGRYPRREPAPEGTSREAYAAADADATGDPRAWLYENGIWTEITNSLPDGMRGALTTVTCAHVDAPITTPQFAVGTCFAGGWREIWRWRTTADGEGFDPQPSTAGLADFHNRVRQIRFANNNQQVLAITSGCCASPDPTTQGALSGARLLTSSAPRSDAQAQRWTSASFSAQPGLGDPSSPGTDLPAGPEDAADAGAPLAESYYGFVYSGYVGNYNGVIQTDLSAIASPAAPKGSRVTVIEPGSRVVLRVRGATPGTWGHLDPEIADAKLDSVRLQATDGDFERSEMPTDDAVQDNTHGPDGVLDWAVGRFKERNQGIAFTTVDSILPLPSPLTCTLGDELDPAIENAAAPNCDPAVTNLTGSDFASKRLLAMPSYGLNAMTFVPQLAGTEAWSAGDRGAITRLGGNGRVGAEDEPDAAKVGARNPSRLTQRAPFDPFRPGPPAPPGVVPPAAQQPVEDLSSPEFANYGTPDPTRWFRLPKEDVSSIAMSRDGAEGWAVGGGGPFEASAETFTVQHFDGERWVRCDPTGLGGAYDPDPACESLQELLGDGKARTLGAIERVPLERDDDPSNDDEFAAIAIGSQLAKDATAAAIVLRYEGGRWSLDREASEVIETGGNTVAPRIAFRNPTDAWVVTHDQGPRLYHFGPDPDDDKDDGDERWPEGRWIACRRNSTEPECGMDLSDGATPMPADASQGHNIDVHAVGDSVYMGGSRQTGVAQAVGGTGMYPVVWVKRDGEKWQPEYDPGCETMSEANECQPEQGAEVIQGSTYGFSIADLGGGRTAGWLVGRWGGQFFLGTDDTTRATPLGTQHVLVQRDLDADHGEENSWHMREKKDAADDHLPFVGNLDSQNYTYPHGPKIVTFNDDGTERTFITPARRTNNVFHPALEYDASTDEWRVMQTPWISTENKVGTKVLPTQGAVTAVEPDGNGGLWTAVQPLSPGAGPPLTSSMTPTFYYHRTGSRHQPVYEEAANPVQEPITGVAGRPNGEVWVSTESDKLYHYDRLVGWERVRIAGWDRGRIVTRPSHTLAVDVNRDGVGIAVGEDGRIADITPEEVTLNPASGVRCSDAPPPCGTPQDLHAAAVAPDGSAMVAGDKLAIAWRPAGGDFRMIARPRASLDTTITGLAMPDPDHVWLSTSAGEIHAGTRTDGGWAWRLESTRASASDEREERGFATYARLNAIEVDPAGRGLAVGYRGAMLERSPDGTWTRLNTGFLDTLYSIAFPPEGYADGVLVGGEYGVILTRVSGEFRVARRANAFDPLTTGVSGVLSGRIVGLTVAGGRSEHDVESWAASQVDSASDFNRDPAPFALLHHASGDDPMLRPGSRVRPLPDAPAREPGELTLAALGRSECQFHGSCPPGMGSQLFHEIVLRRIRAELRERREEDGESFAAIYTGDITFAPGRNHEARQVGAGVNSPHLPGDVNVMHDQWRETFVEPLAEDGVPLFAVPGKTDITRPRYCQTPNDCVDPQDSADGAVRADAGLSLQWRTTFANMPEPWGATSEPAEQGDVEFAPVDDIPLAQEAPGGGARTHYAVDVTRDGERVARLIFLDNSFARSLTAGEASQNPIEGQGGQLGWLERVLCIRGETCAGNSRSSRAPGQPAVVVTNSPAYSPGPGGLDSVQADASTLETLLLRHRATAVISGRVGWNGLFYTLAAGLHAPCPGGAYPERPPSPDEGVCSGQATDRGLPQPPEVPGASELANALRGLGAPVPPQADEALGTADELRNAIPNLIASTAGGRFGPRGEVDGEASDGFWHGYSIMRIRKTGDVIVEQRPILDWIGIDAQEHTLKPGQRMTLRGYGREPVGTDSSIRIDRIDSPAITHRYDLVLADEQNPSRPKEDASGNYVKLDPSVATVDPQTGVVRVGRGRQARTYAVAILSVGKKAASWPLVFEPAKSFRPRPATTSTVRTPAVRTPVSQPLPPIHIKPTTPTPSTPKPPSQPPVSTPTVAGLELPPPPQLPQLPQLPGASPTVPPAPPAPPAPPSSGEPLPLSLQAPISAVSIVPTVIPPTPPPINPAPPGGSAARKEAKQRQAATAKSEEGGGDAATNPEDSQPRTNMGDSPNAFTRYDGTRYSFTAVRDSEQVSAWSRGLLYGGGTAILAFVLAAGWTAGRPRGRPKDPVVPAPAWNDRRRTR